MQNTRTMGFVVAGVGLLLTCCLCPLALNNALVIATSSGNPRDIFSLYGQIFSTKLGNLTLSNYVIVGQEGCATVLALAILVGGVLIARAKKLS